MMAQAKPGWQIEIEAQFDADTAAQMMGLVEALMADQTSDVLRQFVSELILEARTLRDLTRQIEQSVAPEVRAAVLLHKDGAHEPLTVEGYTQLVLAHVAKSRQLLDYLKFYAMALGEDKITPP